MGKDSAIEWTDHTFNPWWGCTKVSAGCANCYAEAFAKWTGRAKWGPDAPRVPASEKTWREPLEWDRAAAAAGRVATVFCASMADVFERRAELQRPRARLFDLVDATPHLFWLFLTKRPSAARELIPDSWYLNPRANVGFGTSIEDPAAVARASLLLSVPARLLFFSFEPLLGHVAARALLDDARRYVGAAWAIVGGESGPGARPLEVDAVRALRLDAVRAHVPFFVKQLGARVVDRNDAGFDGDDASSWPAGTVTSDLEHQGHQGARVRVLLRDRKGGDPSEWPEELRVREFPAALERQLGNGLPGSAP